MSAIETFLEQTGPSGPIDIPFRETIEGNGIHAVSVVPVAAHQEDVEQPLDVYNQQSSNEKWQTFLYLNAPSDTAKDPQVGHNVETLERHGNDLGSSGNLRWGLRLYDWGGEDGEFSIGRVRKDGWIYALDNLLRSGISETSVGFSHDADMVGLSPKYFSKAVDIARELPSHFLVSQCYWSMEYKGTYNTNLPALNRLAAYMVISEEAFRLATRINHMWDCAVGFRLSSYVQSGGYREQSVHTETQPLIEAIKDKGDKNRRLFSPIVGEYVITSMRRYALLAGQDVSPFNPTDPKITDRDEARDASVSFLKAEQNTRRDLADWCNQADEINIAIILEKFAGLDGESVEVRVDFYEELINYGRHLMKVASTQLNGSPKEAGVITKKVIEAINLRASEVLSQSPQAST